MIQWNTALLLRTWLVRDEQEVWCRLNWKQRDVNEERWILEKLDAADMFK